MTKQIIKKILYFVPKFLSKNLSIALSFNVPQRAKGSILFIRMTIKRTFYFHKCLIFNDLRGFIGGGGVKRPKYYVVQTLYF